MSITRLCIATVLLFCTVLSLSAQEAAEDRKNETIFTAAFSLKQGSSDVSLLSLEGRTSHYRSSDEVLAMARLAYGEEDSNTNTEDARARLQYNWLLDDRWYLNARGEAEYDAMADIDYRFLIGFPGVGHYLVSNERSRLALEVAPSYVWEQVGGITDDYPGLRFTQRLEQTLTETASLWESLDYTPEITDWDRYLLNAEFGMKAALNSHLSLTFSIQSRYNSVPAPDAEKQELNLLTGLSYTL